MIRFITRENVALLDSKIEQIYLRRTANPGRVTSCPIAWMLANDIALLRAVQAAQARVDENVDWLCRLASDVAQLAQTTEREPSRPPTPTRTVSRSNVTKRKKGRSSPTSRTRRSAGG